MHKGSPSLIWVRAACALGLIHAGFSLYWALGGRWLLETVGEVAATMAAQGPQRVFLILTSIALFKAAAAVIPLLAAYHKMPWPRAWRAVSWFGGVFLILYGGVNTAAAWSVLLGLIAAPPDSDRPGLLGHALLWDPLFLLWGLSLVVHLWITRTRTRPGRPTEPIQGDFE